MYHWLIASENTGILQHLNQWDTWLFLKINNDWHTPLLDNTLPIWRDKITHIPIYLFLLLFVFINFGWKSWKWLAFVILTIIISDQFSSHFIKYFFDRLRPCNEPAIMDRVRFLLSYRPQNPSFTSSHAVNHFAVGYYFYKTLKPYIHNWAYLFFVWAATICYAQVYVGVHYPGDIIGGAIVGLGIGYLTSYLFNHKVGMPPLRSTQQQQSTI